MPADYLSVSDAEFETWLVMFMNYLNANTAALGLLAADVTPITLARNAWTNSFTAHNAAQAAAIAAAQAKNQARVNLLAALRPLIGRLQASPAVTDAQRGFLGIPIHSKDRTPSPMPTTRPMLVIESGQRLCHTIRFSDEAKPNSRAKPKGVAGCQIWGKVGEAPPADCTDCRFLATDTSSPYLVEYTGAEKNQIAHYMARWINTRGEPGPWSETAAATIGA